MLTTMISRRSLFSLMLLCAASAAQGTVPPKVVLDAVQAQAKGAELGNADDMAGLGWRYFNGDGVPRNYAEAVKWFRAASAKGSSVATYGLAVCLQEGKGVDMDRAEGDRLMGMAADAGNPAAQNSMGYAAEQRGDLAGAAQWYRKAANQNHTYGLFNLGLLYRFGRGIPADPAQAHQLLLAAANGGDADAMFQVADMLADGEGVSKDLAAAREWFRRAALLGDAKARYQLARFMADGLGGERNPDLAMQLYRTGAEEGNVASIQALADAYLDGNGVAPDPAEGRRWLAKGVERGDELSMVRLGRIYLEGNNVAADNATAAKLFAQAADKGEEQGKYWLAVCYEYGRGVAKDEAKAAEIYRQVTSLFDTLSRLLLMQIEGRGMPQDRAAAYATIDEQIRQGKIEYMLYLGVRLLRSHDDTDAEWVLQRARAAPASAREKIGVANALSEVGEAYRSRGQAERAKPFLKDAVAILERLPDVPPTTLADAVDNLATAYLQEDQPELAEPLFQRSLTLRVQAHDGRDKSVADSYNNLRSVKMALGEYDSAELFSRMSLDLTQAIFGDDASETDFARASFAQLLYFEGRYREAEPLFLQSLTGLEARLGRDHGRLVTPLINAAYNDMELGRLDRAEELIRRANAIIARLSEGKPGPAMAAGLNNLGTVLVAAKRYPDAEQLLLQGLAMRELLLGPEGIDLPFSLLSLGKLYIATGRYADADKALQRALSIVTSKAKDNWEVASILYEQGRSHQQQKNNDQAAATLHRAFAIQLKLQPKHPQTRETARALAALYRDIGQEPAAVQVEQRVDSASDSARQPSSAAQVAR